MHKDIQPTGSVEDVPASATVSYANMETPVVGVDSDQDGD